MSKKIHTIQSSDKEKFEKEVNFFLEYGSELLEGSYEIIKRDDGVVYSQVVVIDSNNYDVGFYDNGQKMYERTYKDGKEDGLWTEWYYSGQKRYEATYKDGERDGKYTSWYESGGKRNEGRSS